jgi:DNA-binding NarL/FixJ family response regulator
MQMTEQGHRRGVPEHFLRALLVDDSPASADLLTAQLQRAGHDVALERVNREEAFTSLLRNAAPDVVFAGSSAAPFTAAAVLRVVQAVRPTVPVILLNEVSDQQSAVACARAGAENVICKDKLDRVGEVVRSALEVRRPLVRLSPRQIEVLRLISQGLTNRQMAQGLGLSEKTVETHRSAVAQRLGIRDVAGLVRYAVRVGLASQAPPYGTRKSEGAGLAANQTSGPYPRD